MRNTIENAKFVVKNTTKCGLMDLVCPHTCRGCGRLGSVFCECCKKYMISQQGLICPLCKCGFAKDEEKSFKCRNCETVLSGVWAVGWREGALQKLVKDYKYKSVRACGEVLAEILHAKLPRELGEEVVVVPLPTISRHVRERGLDHTLILAKKLAKKRGWKCEQVLGRATNTVQVGTKAAERMKQAAKTYELDKKVDPDKVYLLLDDVWTTGASMMAAAKVMKKGGAKEIFGVVIEVGRGDT